MDELERRLKEDAANVRADVSAELSRRIEASLIATERAPTAKADPGRGFSPWWLSSLTGAAVALMAIVAIVTSNRNEDGVPDAPGELPVANTVPELSLEPQTAFPLQAESAVLTGSLEEELEMLKSDLEKARRNVAEEFKESF